MKNSFVFVELSKEPSRSTVLKSIAAMYKCQCDQYKKATTHLTKFGVVEVDDDHCIVPQTGSVWIPISAHLYCGSSGQALAFLCTMVTFDNQMACLTKLLGSTTKLGDRYHGCWLQFHLVKAKGG